MKPSFLEQGKRKILPRPGDSVKARIIGAGVRFSVLAKASRLSRPALSNYIAGRRKNRHGQFEIAMAFSSLIGEPVTMEGFWGELLNKEVA